MIFLADEQMPVALEHWETVEVYCQSWGSEMKPGRWQSWMVKSLRPWHVWRYEAPNPSEATMAKAAAVRERMNVGALKGNGFYVDQADYDDGELER